MISKQEERLEKILSILKLSNPATVNKLAQLIEVSHMTIRRDIEILEREKKVEVFHGGIMLPDSQRRENWKEYTLADATSIMCEEKKRIGLKAALMLKNNDSLILDTGSTTEYISQSLNPEYSLSIVCFTLNTLIHVSKLKKSKIIFPGGYFHRNTLMFESEEGISILKKNRAAIAFVSASGISLSLGVTCSNSYERETKKTIMGSSMKKVLVADSSKFDIVHSTYFAELQDFDTVITDEGIPDKYRTFCNNNNIELLTV
ncbi:MAG: DeoR/GlpR transcriptional regulator [Spirochaetes bacterium]|nr:MAG: DeoR/GlpR transcriptional regulator [Spirochaetota bacterium]